MLTRTGPQLLPQYRDVTIQMVEKRRQHWYRVGGHEELLPSVTTILKVIDKSGPLVGWARKDTLEKVGKELHSYAARPLNGDDYTLWVNGVLECAKDRIYRTKDEAADAGNAAHRLIAELLHGGKPDIPDELAPAVCGALEMVSDYGLTVEAVECPVWHPRYEYAGTVDLIARDTDGRLVVVDWKRAKGIYDEHAYQVAAYARAVEALTGEDVASAYVVRLPREQSEDVQYECRQAFTPVTYEIYMAAHRLWLSLNTDEEVWLS